MLIFKGKLGKKIKRGLPYLVAGVLIGSFIRLGLWQLSRAEEKEAIEQALQNSQAQAPFELRRYQPQTDYSAVRLYGEFDERQIHLVNQLVEGQHGVHVYMPFVLQLGGPVVLVNRGWIAMPVNQSTAVLGLDHPDSINGMLRSAPRVGIELGDVILQQDQWPQSVPYLQLEELADALKMPLAEQILLSTESSDDGLLRDWQLKSMPPVKHRAYALQWFTMAAAVFILMVVVVRASRKRHNIQA